MIESLTNSLNPAGLGSFNATPDPEQRFASILDRQIDSPIKAPVELGEAERNQRDEEVYEAAQQLVSSAFVAPLLAHAREIAKQNDMFYGGSTEDLFGQRMDQMLADKIVASSRFPMVDAVYREITTRGRGWRGDAAQPAVGGRVNTHG